MKTRFDILFMDEAWHFILSLDEKVKAKVAYNMERSREVNDPEVFKKVGKNIWEFRTEYANKQIRLFAFWSPNERALVVCTHGLFKQKQKLPRREIVKAERMRSNYLGRPY
jgi:phage-related protein